MLTAPRGRAAPDPPTGSNPGLEPSARWAPLIVAVTTLAVAVLGAAAVRFRPEGSQISTWWPGAGVAVVGMLLVPPRFRPLLLGGVGVGALFANLFMDREPLVVAGLVAANVITPLVAVAVLELGRHERPRLLTVDDFGRLVLAGISGGLVSGLVAGLATDASLGEGFFTTWGGVTASHAAAILIIAPLAMEVPSPKTVSNRLEAAAQVAFTVATVLLVFSPGDALPLTTLVLGPMLWGAVRLPVRWVSVELVLVGAVASLLTTIGHGPFASVTERGFPPETISTLLQSGLLIYALMTLPLALTVHRHQSASQAARESNELLQSVLTGAIGTAIIGWDRAGTVAFFNAGAEAMLGWEADEVVGRFSPVRFHDADEVAARAQELGIDADPKVFTAAVDGGAPWERRDWTLVRRDGTRLVVSMRVTARVTEDGTPLGYLAIAEDVTERRRVESRLRDALAREREALERLEQLDRAKTAFVTSVSHELRTPMTSVLGYTDLVLDGDAGPITPQQRAMLEAAERNGRRLLRLIEDLLTVSHIESGTFTANVGPVDLRTAVTAAVHAVAPLRADRRLDVELELGDRDLVVMGDPNQLERLVTHLLSNAVKFTPDGGRIVVRTQVDRGRAVLEVEDTGVGIPEDEQPQLFQRFFRSRNTQELEIPGTGLGLSITAAIVQAHEGRIDVESREDEGTLVRVELPLSRPASVVRT